MANLKGGYVILDLTSIINNHKELLTTKGQNNILSALTNEEVNYLLSFTKIKKPILVCYDLGEHSLDIMSSITLGKVKHLYGYAVACDNNLGITITIGPANLVGLVIVNGTITTFTISGIYE